MSDDFYTNIGFGFVWCISYIFIPIGVAIAARLIAEKLLPPQPERQRKKRSYKNRLK